MSRQTKDTLKSFFNAGDKPTETQFSDLIDQQLYLALELFQHKQPMKKTLKISELN